MCKNSRMNYKLFNGNLTSNRLLLLLISIVMVTGCSPSSGTYRAEFLINFDLDRTVAIEQDLPQDFFSQNRIEKFTNDPEVRSLIRQKADNELTEQGRNPERDSLVVSFNPYDDFDVLVSLNDSAEAQFLKVTVSGEDREAGLAVANVLPAILAERIAEDRRSLKRRGIKELQEAANKQRSKMLEADKALETFKKQNTDIKDDPILNRKLRELEQRTIVSRDIYDLVQQRIKQEEDDLKHKDMLPQLIILPASSSATF